MTNDKLQIPGSSVDGWNNPHPAELEASGHHMYNNSGQDHHVGGH